MKLKNRVVVITGGGRGIGLATAQRFAKAGARIAIGDVDVELAEQSAASLNGYGGALDVRDPQSFRDFIAATEKALGPVGVVINNAGIMPAGEFLQETDAVSDTQIDINLRGVIHGCKAALPGMLKRGRGHVVNVASLAGVVPIPGLSVYCATKFAVVGLTKSLREEYRDSGVQFSTIMPSKVLTELASGTDAAARGIPAVAPEEVAQAVFDAVDSELGEVTVPRYLSVAPAVMNSTPTRLLRGVRRLVGDQRVLKSIDQNARKGYNARIAKLAES